jgi:hypothetical protein
MKKRSSLFCLLVLSALFFSACGIFAPTAISKNWKGTIRITNHNSALWYVDPAGQGNDGVYTAEITFSFDWFSDANKINGGTLALNPVSHDISVREITNPPYTISTGAYTPSDETLLFNAEIVSKPFTFEGTVKNGILTGSSVKEMLQDQLTVVGTIDISAQ